MDLYFDIESAIQRWLKSNPRIAPLLTRPDNGVNVFKAMPNAAPLPSLVLSRVGGAPARADMAQDTARISFDCWAVNREQAVVISLTLVSEIENLSMSGGYNEPAVRLPVAETVSWLWMPDKASDTPRYVVDALFTAIPG